MAFADPQSLTVGASATTLDRVFLEPGVGTFEAPDNALILTLRPSKTASGRIRQVLQVDRSGVGADPLTGVNSRLNQRATLIVDSPSWGFTDAQTAELVTGIKTWLSPANIAKLVAGEN